VKPRRLLITAGPTHEPIDAVRFLGNRSSGRVGIELADAAAGGTSDAEPWSVTLLLGPTALAPAHPHVNVRRFQTTADLQGLLRAELPNADVLIMAAAVADFVPKRAADPHGKLTRASGPTTLELVPTPDLLAECSSRRRFNPPQLLIGFALEPRTHLLESARSKLERKRIDAIIANPLETIDASDIGAKLLWADGTDESTPGPISKSAFALWLLAAIDRVYARSP
jgi:phosphopantothenoylcysteine decarboxylase / phosphopantothenate---cysteine ligase